MSKVRSAIVWSAIDTFWRQGMAFAISVVLARLLTPEDFGTVALLSLFIALAGVIANAGFTQALIQKKDTTHTDESTVFWFNIGMGFLLALLLCAAGPVFARVYDIPALEPLTYVMALNVFLGAAGSIQQTMMTKNLAFRTLTRIGVISTLLSGGVAIYLAWTGAGLWALAAQAVVVNVATVVMLWLFNSWRPAMTFSMASFRSLFSFGGYMFAAAIVDTTYKRGNTLLIGTLYGVRELGFYQRALRSQELPVQLLTQLVSRVMFPVMSSVNDDHDQLRTIATRFIRQIMFIAVPIMIGLSVLADLFIKLVFGDQWLSAVPLLSVLCLAGAIWPFQVVNLSLLKSLGHGNLFFRIELIKKSLGILFIIIGSMFGVIGIAWAAVALGLVSMVINAHYSAKFLDFGLIVQIRQCAATLISGGVMAACVYLARLHYPLDDILAVPVFVGLGAVTYFACHAVIGRSTMIEAKEMVMGKTT